ncbi:MAG: hypothetical protein SGILL_010410 [Bacillariaceae sp.]
MATELTQQTREERREDLLKDAKFALKECKMLLNEVEDDLFDAKEVAALAGLSIESRIVAIAADPVIKDGGDTATVTPAGTAATADTTTGGFSNSDHIISATGDYRMDRISELKRFLKRRTRAMLPEHRRDERWDKPKAPGERRRKIVLEKDLEDSPPEPPTTGWKIFLGQMTTKYRHDEGGSSVHHDQAKALAKIAAMWRSALSDDDRDYYQNFATEAREEYKQQVVEYRATGSFTPSHRFAPIEDTNIWVRLDNPCELEREISAYETVKFAPRPPEMDQAYEERLVRSVVIRKLKIKKLLDEDGNPDSDVDFEGLMEEERRKRKKRKRLEEKEKPKARYGSGSGSGVSPAAKQQRTQVVYESLKALAVAPPPAEELLEPEEVECVEI